MVDVSLGEHRIIFKLRLAERRGVAGDDDELSLSGAEGLEGRLVSKSYCERCKLAIDSGCC